MKSIPKIHINKNNFHLTILSKGTKQIVSSKNVDKRDFETKTDGLCPKSPSLSLSP